jgi:aspartate aminotransferase
MKMTQPRLSAHTASRKPSSIRVASIEFARRADATEAVNVAIGNVSLPMHPALQARLRTLGEPGSPFANGAVQYTSTVGTTECREAFLNVIASSGFDTHGLHCQITDGGSQAMELMILAACGPAGTREKPLLLIDAAYTNYTAFARRLGRATVSITRTLQDDGKFTLPPLDEIAATIEQHDPGAMVVIPYDNPTGHFYDHDTLVSLAKLCVEHDLWMLSDEAYRELFYVDGRTSSIWGITEKDAPGIAGRRVSIETSSKVWNACGLRTGALVTDNEELHTHSVAENTASLCSNAIGQHLFGALAHEKHEDLQAWYARQRDYYRGMLDAFTSELRERVPGAIVSSPDASIYSVIDVRDCTKPGFDALEFVLFCAREGRVDLDGKSYTLLTAPMAGFYDCSDGRPHAGRTQMRVAYVETPQRMAMVPRLFAELLTQYEARR